MKNMFKFLIMIIIIICMCESVAVFAACSCGGTGTNNVLTSNNSSTHTAKVYCSSCGKYLYQSQGRHSFSGSWTQTREPTCSEQGIERRWCSAGCGESESRGTGYAPHSWSDWLNNDTKHWKECNNCDATGSDGEHHDDDINGYCDDCNYLMAIPGSATISSNVAVKEGEGAAFSIEVTAGTEPITYQWYYNTSNSTTNGTAVSNATSTSLSISTTTRDMNGRYYYCAMTNKAGTHYSPTALLTVYYPFTIGTQPGNFELKKGETATYSVGIGTAGNPNAYNYQWYIADSSTGEGNRIAGATSSSYVVTPTANVHEAYYYCKVDNTQYELTSNRGKLVADITVPTITMGTFNQDLIINKDVTLTIPFTVTDTGEGYTEGGTNFTASDFIIKTDGVTNSNVTRNLVYNGSSGNNHSYTLTISNMTGNGVLSLEVPASSIADNFSNGNDLSIFNTNVIVDNIAPVISAESIDKGINGKYANSEDEIVIKLAITEAVGIDTAEFEAADITINVGGAVVTPSGVKRLVYTEKIGNKYIYTLTISGVPGNGEIKLGIAAGKIKDLANNPNIDTTLTLRNSIGENIIIDNVKPTIDSLATKFDSYTSSSDYPTSLAANHLNWAKEDIYVQINATDNYEIDYYTKSENGTTHNKMTSHQEIIATSINANMIYRVYDMAGNYSEITREIKLDKITPVKPVILLTEQRQNGAPYIYNEDEPTSKSIYVIPNLATVVDTGAVQSGIDLNKTYTYYTVKRYKDVDKVVAVGETDVYAYDELAILKESGYYEIEMTMTDIAGNQVKTDIYKVYINKGVENTIRIKNINDIGSGVSRVIINIYDEDGNEAISEIVIDNPYKEIIKNVRLREGSFDVRVTLIDKVGNIKVLNTTITNSF